MAHRLFRPFRQFQDDLSSPPTTTNAPSVPGAETSFTAPTKYFHAMTTGNITVRFLGDTADRTFPVIQAAQYVGRITHVRSTSVASILGQW